MKQSPTQAFKIKPKLFSQHFCSFWWTSLSQALMFGNLNPWLFMPTPKHRSEIFNNLPFGVDKASVAGGFLCFGMRWEQISLLESLADPTSRKRVCIPAHEALLSSVFARLWPFIYLYWPLFCTLPMSKYLSPAHAWDLFWIRQSNERPIWFQWQTTEVEMDN